MKAYKNQVTTEHRFNSPGDMVAWCQALSVPIKLEGSWTGGFHSEKELFARLRSGDDTYVVEAESLIEDIMRGLRIETIRNEWVADMVGAYADVPAFLAGMPASMRRKVVVTQEVAPMKLFVCLTSSCGVSIETLKRRGVCLLALVIALTRIRPVELYTFNAVSSYIHQNLVDIVKMPTSPIDVGLIAFCLVNQGFTRGLCYSYLDHHHHGILYNPPEKNMNQLRLTCGAGPNDTIFPPIHLYDDYKDPKKWVKSRLAEILKLNQEQIEALT